MQSGEGIRWLRSSHRCVDPSFYGEAGSSAVLGTVTTVAGVMIGVGRFALTGQDADLIGERYFLRGNP